MINDWPSYVEQGEFILEGNYDYSKIRGSNGFVYYPAGHLYFYALLSILKINYSIFGSMLFMAALHWILSYFYWEIIKKAFKTREE
jgi:hypothetical protein